MIKSLLLSAVVAGGLAAFLPDKAYAQQTVVSLSCGVNSDGSSRTCDYSLGQASNSSGVVRTLPQWFDLVGTGGGGGTGIAGVAPPLTLKTAAFTYTIAMHNVYANAATSGFAATLPPCVAGTLNYVFGLEKYDSTANPVVLTASGSDLISGYATVSLASQWQAVSVQCNGAGVWLRGLN